MVNHYIFLRFNLRNIIDYSFSNISHTEINLIGCILILTTCLTQFLLDSHWIGNSQNFSSLHVVLVELLWILCLEYLNRSFRSEIARLQGFLDTCWCLIQTLIKSHFQTFHHLPFRICHLNTVLINRNSFFWIIINDIEPFTNTVFICFNALILTIICRHLVVVNRTCQDLFPIDVHTCLVQILLGWFNSRNIIYNCISLISVTEINLVSRILK